MNLEKGSAKDLKDLENKIDLLKEELSNEMEKSKKFKEEDKKLLIQNQNQDKEIKELKTRLSECEASLASGSSIRNEVDLARKTSIFFQQFNA